MPWQGQAPLDDGQQNLINKLDEDVSNNKMSIADALYQAQQHGITTGDGAYTPPGFDAANAAELNKESVQTREQSEAYQQSRANNPAGYDAESQKEFDEEHPADTYPVN
jgi:hypothetical protein